MWTIYYKPEQITINAPGLAEVFIVVTVRHVPPRPPRLDYTLRLNRHLKVLVFSMLLPRRQATTIQSSSSTGFKRCYATSRYRYRLMHSSFLTWSTETHSSTPSSGARVTTFRLGYNYTLLSLTTVTTYASPAKILALVLDSISSLMTACRKNLPHRLDIANLFSPDLWGYVHGFGHQPESLIALFAHYNPLKLVW